MIRGTWSTIKDNDTWSTIKDSVKDAMCIDDVMTVEQIQQLFYV